jgi:hypothetical protein
MFYRFGKEQYMSLDEQIFRDAIPYDAMGDYSELLKEFCKNQEDSNHSDTKETEE